MRNIALGIGSLVLLAPLGCAHNQHHESGEAKKIAPADVPAKVMDTVNGRLPGAQVVNVEKENENGGIVYDFELTQQGRKFEMDVKDDGTLMEVEKQIDPKNAPAAVMNSVQAKYPRANLKEVMEVDKVTGKQETADHYEVTMTMPDGKEKEVVVGMDGAVKEEGGGK